MDVLDGKIKLLENRTNHPLTGLVRLAQRDNNNKRKFLLINEKQGKHMPVSPHEALNLFEKLADILLQQYGDKSVAVIGFAETATAIGAAVATAFGPQTPYLHTTREILAQMPNLVEFYEEHSHAVNQSLYCRNPEQWLGKAEVIIFVEDEISTGKTILNFINALQSKGYLHAGQQIVAASLINGMGIDALEGFARQEIMTQYLLKIGYSVDLDPYPALSGENLPKPSMTVVPAGNIHTVIGRIDSRAGGIVGEYQEACEDLAQQVSEILAQQGGLSGSVLVLGAEEFMYPPIWVAKVLEERWAQCDVKVHATTRSPIKATGALVEYPLFNRTPLDSLYEVGRQTYVYNLTAYDTVIVLFDSHHFNEQAYVDLYGALWQFGCKRILGIRWVDQ